MAAANSLFIVCQHHYLAAGSMGAAVRYESARSEKIMRLEAVLRMVEDGMDLSYLPSRRQ
jgi:hypothetical protein